MIENYLYILGSFVFSSIVCFRIIPVIVTISRSKKLFDSPNSRSSHVAPTPSLGGLAIFFGFIISVLLFGEGAVSSEVKYTITAVVLLTAVGLKDDILVISAGKKFVIQICAALILIVLADIRITNLQGLFGLYEIGYAASLILTLLVIVFMTNAINLLDGIDGLCSGLISSVCIIFGSWMYMQGKYDFAIVAASLLGSLVAFFCYNVFGKKNKIFMGDTGSLLLGIVVSALGITICETTVVEPTVLHFNLSPVLLVSAIIVPIVDTFRVFTIRILNKRSPFSPDKNHLHHRLLALGYCHIKASVYLIVFNLLFFVTMVFLRDLNINVQLLVMFAISVTATYLLDRAASRRESVVVG